MRPGVVHDGTPEEVADYQAREAKLADELAEHPRYLQDGAGSLDELVRSITEDTYFATRVLAQHPVEIEEVAEVIVVGEHEPQLAEGEVLLGYANVWRHPGDGELRIDLVLLEDSAPLVVLHELAHALDIEDGHGPGWRAHLDALVRERYLQ